MTNTVQGSLTLLNVHTKTPQVFWNGTMLEGVKSIDVDYDSQHNRVVLTLSEDPVIAEMQAAGILIRRK